MKNRVLCTILCNKDNYGREQSHCEFRHPPTVAFDFDAFREVECTVGKKNGKKRNVESGLHEKIT